MKLENITTSLTKVAGKGGLVLKQRSPQILLLVGVVGAVGATVLACKATLKLEDVLDIHTEKVEMVKSAYEQIKSREDIPDEEYTEKDYKRDLAVVYTQTSVDMVKLYGVPAALGIASIACIIGGQNILQKRNVALVAAYKAVEESFGAYRGRVIEEFGEQKDYIFKHGLKEEVVTENEKAEDGKTKKVKKTRLDIGDTNGLSCYARMFDETNTNWSKSSDYNLMFLKSQQNMFNDLLQARGHVFLNEVYDALGIPRSKPGAVVGWMIGPGGDNFIDFGIFDGDNPRARDFVNGYERSIILDFNVDGVIYDCFTRETV